MYLWASYVLGCLLYFREKKRVKILMNVFFLIKLLIRRTLRESSVKLLLLLFSFASFITLHSNGKPSRDENVLLSESSASAVNDSGESSKYKWVVVCLIRILWMRSTITSHRINLSVLVSLANMIEVRRWGCFDTAATMALFEHSFVFLLLLS